MLKVTVVPRDINFGVIDPHGKVILKASAATEKVFSFEAGTTGNYRLYFIDSETSVFDNKVVLVQVQYPWGGSLSYFADTYVSIKAKEVNTVALTLADNQGVKGSFNIEGGQEELGFSIRDPDGKMVVSAGKVSHSHTFAFTAAESGAYQLRFDNTSSSKVSKLVSLELYTNLGGQFQPWDAATKLVFTTSPSGATAGVAFSTQPVVTVQDGNGNKMTDSSAEVTVAITEDTGTSGAILSGTTTVSAVNGVG
ncbi:emp24/gp25L/p24 family protein [Chloroflexota bacterium]